MAFVKNMTRSPRVLVLKDGRQIKVNSGDVAEVPEKETEHLGFIEVKAASSDADAKKAAEEDADKKSADAKSGSNKNAKSK